MNDNDNDNDTWNAVGDVYYRTVTNVHRPHDEIDRIEAAGGWISETQEILARTLKRL